MKLNTKKGTKLFLIPTETISFKTKNGKIGKITRIRKFGWWDIVFWIKFQYRKYFED